MDNFALKICPSPKFSLILPSLGANFPFRGPEGLLMKIKEGFTGQRSLVVSQLILDLAERDPILQSLHISAMGYYPRAQYHFRKRELPISDYILIYCVDGKGWFELNGIRHVVAQDSFFILPPGIPHSYGASEKEPWTIYWIHFKGSLASAYAPSSPDAVYAGTLMPSPTSRIRERNDLFEEIFETLDRGITDDSFRYATALFHHYLATLKFLTDYRGTATSKQQDNLVDSIIHYMEENIEKELTLKMLSDYAGYSSSYISSLFKSQIGLGPLAYFNHLKIRHACRLLADTDMKVNTVCHKVGISDPYYFSRLFSKVMGMSPTEYRTRSQI